MFDGRSRALKRKGIVLKATCIAFLILVASVAVMPTDDEHHRAEAAPAAGVDAESSFVGLVPARLADTRVSGETVDGEFVDLGPVGAGGELDLTVVGRGGVPDSGVGAVVLNVSGAQASSRTFVTVYPAGAERPLTSNLNLAPGPPVPNLVIAKVGNDGKVSLYNDRGSAHLIVDVMGWMPAGSDYVGLVPARLADTRVSGETVDGEFVDLGPVGAGGELDLTVVGRGGVPDSGVGAVVLNVSGAQASSRTFVTVYPAGAERPLTSNLNLAPGPPVPNLVIAKVGNDGKVSLYNDRGSAHLIVDVMGWMPAGSDYVGLVPARLADTRVSGETVDGEFVDLGPVGAGGELDLTVVGRGGVPDSGVGAVVLNVSGAQASSRTFVTVYPAGAERPLTSNLNLAPGPPVPNLVIAKVGNDGKVSLYNDRGSAHLIVDVMGWMPLATNQPDSNVNVVDPGEASLIAGGQNTGAATFTIASSDVEVGEVVVVTLTDGMPYYGRVTTVVGDVVTTDEVALADVIPAMDISLVADTETGSVVVADVGAGLVSNFSASTFLPPTEALTFDCEASGQATFTAEVTAEPGKFIFDVDYRKFPPKLNSIRVGYNPTITAEISASASAELTCDANVELPDIPLPTIGFTVGPVPVVITQKITSEISAVLTASASVSRTLTTSASAYFGVEYNDGDWERTADFNFDGSDISTVDAGADLRAELPVTYESRMYGLLGFDATVIPYLELEYRPLEVKYLALYGGVEGSIGATIELDLKVIDLKYSKTFGTTDLVERRELWSKGGWAGTITVSNQWVTDPRNSDGTFPQGKWLQETTVSATFRDLHIERQDVDRRDSSTSDDDVTIFSMSADDFKLTGFQTKWSNSSPCPDASPEPRLFKQYGAPWDADRSGSTEDFTWSSRYPFKLILDKQGRLVFDPSYMTSTSWEGRALFTECTEPRWIDSRQGYSVLEHLRGRVYDTREDAFLPDNDPDPDRIVGSVTYNDANRPVTDEEWDRYVEDRGLAEYSYVVTYDLTRD